MGEPVLQIDNAAHWQQVYSEQKTRASGQNGEIPIPDFDIPILLTSHVLAVGTSSEYARSHWWLGCRVQQVLSATGTGFGYLPAAIVNIPVNRVTLVILPRYAAQFRLRVSVPYWHRELRVTVYEYVGPISDSTEDLVVERTDVVRVDLARIEAKVDDL